MIGRRWHRFCLIGIGGHARNRLIPALIANGQELVGMVSTKPAEALPDAPVFGTVQDAVAALPTDTAFVIASPPVVHAAQAMTVLNAGRDLIVEKPAFITENEARAAATAAVASGAILVEGYMNRYTAMHRRFLDDFAAQSPAAIDCVFTIPQAPSGTFRTGAAIGASNLYDIASYFLAALIDAGLSLDDLDLMAADWAGQPDRERLHFLGRADTTTVTAITGIDADYANCLTATQVNGTLISYSPFFFGRAAQRTITITANTEKVETINDGNAFEAMFAVPRTVWLTDQNVRLRRMIALTAALERFGEKLARLRSTMIV